LTWGVGVLFSSNNREKNGSHTIKEEVSADGLVITSTLLTGRMTAKSFGISLPHYLKAAMFD
jgi:hypothetical protein